MGSSTTSGTTSRRTFLTYGAAGISTVGLGGCLGGSSGGEYPSQRIKVVVPYGQGGGTDSYGRIIANTIPDVLGESVEIDNQPGAGSLLGVGQVAASESDGYTLGSMNIPGTPVAFLRESPNWDLSNFEMISTIGGWQFVLLANPDVGVEGIDDMIQRYESGEFTDLGGVATGNSLHALALFLKDRNVVPWSEYIPYGSGGEAIQNVVSGEVPVTIAGDVPSLSTVEEGRADIVATFRIGGSPVYPDTPSFTDQGYTDEEEVLDLLGGMKNAWFAPSGTPSEKVDTISSAIQDVVDTDAVAEWESETGFSVEPAGPESTVELTNQALQQIPQALNLDRLDG